MHVLQFEVGIVIDVIQMQERRDSGISASALQMGADIDALHVPAEELGCQAAGPFVEIAGDDAMRRELWGSQDSRGNKLPGLFAAFQIRGAQMKREEVDGW